MSILQDRLFPIPTVRRLLELVRWVIGGGRDVFFAHTELYADLRISGDDAWELIERVHQVFRTSFLGLNLGDFFPGEHDLSGGYWLGTAPEKPPALRSFTFGHLLDPDHREVARWSWRARVMHDGGAEYNLALMYRSGDGLPRSACEAARLFRDAAWDGIGAARAHLPKPAPGTAQRVVTQGLPDDNAFLQAQRALLSPRPQETANVVVLFRQAAAAGGPAAAMALYDLGWCYENGIGVAADTTQAYALYVRAAAVTADHGLRDLAETSAVNLRATMSYP